MYSINQAEGRTQAICSLEGEGGGRFTWSSLSLTAGIVEDILADPSSKSRGRSGQHQGEKAGAEHGSLLDKFEVM